jgi:hypothetical protein
MLSITKALARWSRSLGVIGLVILALITTIGTGGGGGGDGTTPAAPTNPLDITTTNAVEVAENAASSASLTDVAVEYAYLPYGVSVANRIQAKDRLRVIFAHAKASLNKITHAGVADFPQGIHVELEGMCDTGSATFDWDDANANDLLSAGEVLQLTFNNCHDATDDLTLNGKTTLTVNSITGDPQNDAVNWSVGITLTDENASFEDAFEKVTLNGSMTITVTNNAAASTVLFRLEGTSYSASWNGDVGRLTNFVFSTLVNSALGTYEVDADYTLADSELGGVITVVTNPVFSGLLSEPGNPTAGKMTITGAGGATVTIEPFDELNALVSLDANGDGTFENTWQVAWLNLE